MHTDHDSDDEVTAHISTHRFTVLPAPSRDNALYATEDEYRAAIATCAAKGIKLEMTHITIPESITLGLVEQRDADIAQICRCIENAGRAGLRGLNYNFLVGAACESAKNITDGHQPVVFRFDGA